jgi:hypothetical protein
MRTWTFDRLGAAAGVGFVVLTLIADLAAGDPPNTGEPAFKIASFFNDHHRAVVVGAVLGGIAGPLFVCLLAALALRLRALGMTAWAGAVFGFGLVGVSLGIVSDAIYGSLARVAATAAFPTTKSLYIVSGFAAAKSFWFATGAMLAVAIGAWRVLPHWYGVLSLVTAVVSAFGGIALKQDGFLAPLGGLTAIAFVALLVWVMATAAMLWLTAEPAEKPLPATAAQP